MSTTEVLEKADKIYEYVYFSHIEDKTKTSVWSCRTNRTKDELGIVEWYPAWRSYCYFPTVQAVYSSGCLNDIKDFIDKLMAERK